VVGEIAVLPLAFGDWPVAIIWSVLIALLLRPRIGVEMTALAPSV
jgi:methyltransferase